MRAVEIGWFQRSEEGRELGPFSLGEMRRRWAAGELERDSEVRHSLDAHHRYAGDVEEFREAGTEGMASCPCLRHPKRPAVRFCLCCWAPICAQCQLKDRNCRRCHHGLYDRRLLAGIVDLLVVPLLILTFAWLLLAPSDSKRSGPYYFEYCFVLSYPLLLLGFVQLKDWWGSPGKWLFGLRVVDIETRRPCGLLASLQRNFLLPLIYAFPFYYWHSAGEALFGAMWTGLFVMLAEKSGAYRDPMMRRPSEYWAGTRVLRTPEGVKWRRVDTKRKLAKAGLQIHYPGSQPDQPGSPRNSAGRALPLPSGQPGLEPAARPVDAERKAEAADSIAETGESTEGPGD